MLTPVSVIALFMENQKPMEYQDCTVKSSRMSEPQGIKETAGEVTHGLRPPFLGLLWTP